MKSASPAPARPHDEIVAAMRAPVPGDGSALWRIARDSTLDLNSPYAYVMWCDYFADSSVVADLDGEVVGFAMGFRPSDQPATVFVWQVAVDADRKQTGLASRMLDHLVERLPTVRFLEATVTPSNVASAQLFRSLAKRHGASVREDDAFGVELFPDGAHEPEIRFRIGPFCSAG